jgi:predicted DNA repair protein MutK
MAGTSLLALLDDIATVLDDISVMTKLAAKKTAGVLGDDLALNAEQVAGVRPERELPVVWAVAKGSMRNKLILVPAALAISAWAPVLITPMLMVGGAFLCYEGFEKLAHRFVHGSHKEGSGPAPVTMAAADPSVDLVAYEKQKIKGAIRTDFILSAEIIIIALGSVQGATLGIQVAVVSGIAVLMTIGVYALVAGIVKLDDAGVTLVKTGAKNIGGRLRRAAGRGLLGLAPFLMKALSVAGTAAMFMVGGGILMHGIPLSHDVLHHAAEAVHRLPAVGGILAGLMPTALNALAGVVAGAVILGLVGVARGLRTLLGRRG